MNAVNNPKIVVVGSYNADFTFRANRFPHPGETLLGETFAWGHGGKGSNQAIAAARLGSSVALVAMVGQEVFGDNALAMLRSEDIDVSRVGRTTATATGAAAILLNSQGENAIIVAPGANSSLNSSWVRSAEPLLENCAVLLVQLEIPLEAVITALTMARNAGAVTILNPAPALALDSQVLRLVDILTPNESEAAALSGRPAAENSDVEQVGRALQERGANTLIITLGEKGALLLERESSARWIPAPKVTARDTSGAGDAFNGALACALARDLPSRKNLYEAIRFANCAGAYCVMNSGTAEAMPRVEDLRRHFPHLLG